MFILGTSSVLEFVGGQPINLIGPIPRTMRAAFGSTGVGGWAPPFAIGLVLAPEWSTRLDAHGGLP